MVLTSSTLCMDSNEWPQIHHKLQPGDLMVSLPLLPSSTATTPTTSSSSSSTKAATMDQLVAGTVKPQPDPSTLKCPRCDSTNTKFCYYNNYSLSQPRHFCKACKRYWTRGGTLRNVPVGGGCRKNKRVKRISTNSSSTSTHLHLDHNATTTHQSILTSSSTMQNPNLFMNNQDHFMHLNNSLMTSVKSAISGLGFPHDKEECNFMQDHQQGGFSSHMTHETAGSNSIFPTSLPNMGQHVGGDHGLNGSVIMASEPHHWIRQIHQHNLFVPLEDDQLGPKSARNDDYNGNSMRNMDMKIEDDHGVGRINMGHIHEWQIPNLNVFEANNITSDQTAGLFWNTNNIGPWTDVNNYGSSSVASML